MDILGLVWYVVVMVIGAGLDVNSRIVQRKMWLACL